jgi:hypothetical protein
VVEVVKYVSAYEWDDNGEAKRARKQIEVLWQTRRKGEDTPGRMEDQVLLFGVISI